MSDEIHNIIDETRRSIIDAILAMGNMIGDKQYHEFAKIVCPSLSEETISDITRHMDRFEDWPESYLLDTVIDYLSLSDEEFMFFLEQYTKQHYADGDRASPKLYSEMVRAHREMNLYGYDVYRFGGYEFIGANDGGQAKQKALNNLKQFFRNLFQKYSTL